MYQFGNNVITSNLGLKALITEFLNLSLIRALSRRLNYLLNGVNIMMLIISLDLVNKYDLSFVTYVHRNILGLLPSGFLYHNKRYYLDIEHI